MAAPITIEVKLGEKEIPANARAIKNALNAELKDVGNVGADAGKRIGNALSSNVSVSLKKIGQEAKAAGTALTAAITLPVLGLGAAVIKTGFDFEKSMNEARAATKANADQMQQLTNLAKQLGNDLAIPAASANDAAAAMTVLAKAGFDVDAVMKNTRGTLILAQAAQIDAAQAAEIMTDALVIFKDQGAQAAQVADLLAATANATKSEVTDVGNALKYAGSAAAGLKIPIEDTVTAIAQLGNAGIRGEQAGTALRSALIRLVDPPKAAAAAMAEINFTAVDQAGKLKPLRQLIEEYTKATADLTPAQKIATASAIAGQEAYTALTEVLGRGTAEFDKMKKAVTEAGAAQQLAAAKAQGGIGAWEAFKSALETLALSIFDIIKGPLIALLQVLNNVVQFLNELPQPVQTVIFVVAALAAAIGPLLVVLGSLIGAVTSIAALFGTTLTVTLSGVASAILPVIAVLAALGVAVFALYKAWKTNFLGLRDLALQAFQGVSAFVSQQFGEIQKIFADILPQLKTLTATVLDAIKKFWADHGQQIIAVVKAYWEVVKEVISAAIKILGNTIKLILAVINGDWKAAWEAAKTIFLTFHNAFIKILTGLAKLAFNELKLLGSVVVDALLFLPKKTAEIGAAIIAGLVNGIKAGASAVVDAMKNIALGALAAAKTALGISSPSREMQIIGEFVGEGFLVGLGKTQGKIDAAIRKLLTSNLKDSRDEIQKLTTEIGAMLAATPKQFKADAQIEQLEKMKDELKQLAALRKELGLEGLSKADIDNFGVTGALAKAQIDKRIKDTGGRSSLILDLPNIENPLAAATAAQTALDDKVSDFARTLEITRNAATNYQRALEAINGELAGADQETKDQLLFFAKRKDDFELAQKQAEQAKQNIQKITDVFNQAFRDGFEKGPKAFFARIFQAGKETFQRLAASALATLTTQILGGFLNRLGGIFSGLGNGGQASGGGGGFGGFLNAIFGGGGAASGGGGTFAGGGGLGSLGGLGGLIKSFTGGGSSSLTAPAAISLPTANVIRATPTGINATTGAPIFGGGVSSLAGLFKGIGFGQAPGSGGALAGALPLLGLSLGSSLGGQSGLGRILGAAGGGLLGIGLSAAPAALAGATSGLGAATAALFSNPITAVVGGALLVGALLLGKAKQRKADEALVDTYWVEYMNTTKDLTAKVQSDQIDGAQALQQALASRQEAINLISQIKTKSVRESRLAHQIPDVDRLFLEPLKQAIEEQKKRGKTIKSIIPEFATGGIVPGLDLGFDSVLALLRPNEVILNLAQQARLQALAGNDIFARAGVPGFGSANSQQASGGVPAFALGGIAEARPIAPVAGVGAINLDVTLEIGEDDVTKLFVNGAQTADGQKVTINTVKTGRKFREL